MFSKGHTPILWIPIRRSVPNGQKYLIVRGHDESTWGSGRRNDSHFLQRGPGRMAAVLVPGVAGPVGVVVALGLLLVLLNWLNGKMKFSSEGEQNISKAESVWWQWMSRRCQRYFNTYFVSFVVRFFFC